MLGSMGETPRGAAARRGCGGVHAVAAAGRDRGVQTASCTRDWRGINRLARPLYTPRMGEWTSIGPEQGRPDLDAVFVGDLEIAIARLADGSWAAFDNACTHEECPLSEGDLEGDRIVCYCHSSEFDVRTGEVLVGPAEVALEVYALRVQDGELQVELP
jgi:nitrite reductase/ring-hydroxylating ferredoxin subunit